MACWLHLHFKYHNLLHVWTTRRVQRAQAVSGGGSAFQTQTRRLMLWCALRHHRAHDAPRLLAEKKSSPPSFVRRCNVLRSDWRAAREETFLIRKHLTVTSLAPWAPCLSSKVIHWWVAAAMWPRGAEESEGEPGLAGNDIVNFTGQCDCNPISHQHIVSSTHKC